MFVFWQKSRGQLNLKKKKHQTTTCTNAVHPLPVSYIASTVTKVTWLNHKIFNFFSFMNSGGRNQYSEADGYRM